MELSKKLLSFAGAMAVRGGRVLYVGSFDSLKVSVRFSAPAPLEIICVVHFVLFYCAVINFSKLLVVLLKLQAIFFVP